MVDRLHEAFVLRAHGLGPLPFRGKEPAFRKGEIQHYRHRRLSDTELRQLFADRSCNIGVFTGDWHLCLDVDGDEGRQTIGVNRNGIQFVSKSLLQSDLTQGTT